MAWATLIIGAALFLIGVLGHSFGTPKRREAQPDEKRAGLFVLRIVAILIGAWLLIIGVANLIRGHRLKSGEPQPHAAVHVELRPPADA